MCVCGGGAGVEPLDLLLKMSGGFKAAPPQRSQSDAACRSPDAVLTGCCLLQDVDSRAALAQLLLSDLLQEENEALLEGEPDDLNVEANDLHVNLERAVAAGPLLAPRERKAGCKNFFWKTFTSC